MTPFSLPGYVSPLQLITADRLAAICPSPEGHVYDRGAIVRVTELEGATLTWRIEADGKMALVVGDRGPGASVLVTTVDVHAGRVSLTRLGEGRVALEARHVAALVAACKVLMPYQEGTLPCVGERVVRGAASALSYADVAVFTAQHHAAQAAARASSGT